jgi:hypothetical protein
MESTMRPMRSGHCGCDRDYQGDYSSNIAGTKSFHYCTAQAELQYCTKQFIACSASN